MSKGFIDDILDNLISKSAKEVENKIVFYFIEYFIFNFFSWFAYQII